MVALSAVSTSSARAGQARQGSRSWAAGSVEGSRAGSSAQEGSRRVRPKDQSGPVPSTDGILAGTNVQTLCCPRSKHPSSPSSSPMGDRPPTYLVVATAADEGLAGQQRLREASPGVPAPAVLQRAGGPWMSQLCSELALTASISRHREARVDGTSRLRAVQGGFTLLLSWRAAVRQPASVVGSWHHTAASHWQL